MTEFLSLKNDCFELQIAPEIGGAITKFTSLIGKRPFDLFRAPSEAALAKKKANECAAFVMAPYCNRIRGASFVYWGIKRSVPLNHPRLPDPIHGDGWQAAWKVEKHAKDAAALSYAHDGKSGFPFPYLATQEIKLAGAQCFIAISIKNTGDLPMPCGLGLHPYFAKTKDVQLKFRNPTVFSNEAAALRDKPYRTPEKWAFDEPRSLHDVMVDACFSWEGEHAEIRWPSEKIRLLMDAHEDFTHIMLFTPERASYFCLEPCTNATDAFNLAAEGTVGTGIQTIEPGETFEGRVEFTLSAL